MRGAILASAITLALLGCSGPNQNDYFPLNKGASWRYRVVTTRSSSETISTQSARVDGYVMVAGQSASVRHLDSGHNYALIANAAGVQRLAMRRDVDEAFALESEPRFVLKAPYVVGSTWQASTVPYLLLRRSEFPPELGLSHSSNMVYSIEAIDAEIKTRSGAYSKCLRVQGIAQLRLFVDPVRGFDNVPLITTEWYCPGVGLTRLERHETVNSPFISGGSITMELEQFTR
jgi:hypothetical protein